MFAFWTSRNISVSCDFIELRFVGGSESLLDLSDNGDDPCPTAGRFRDSPVVDVCFSKEGRVPSGVFCSPLVAALTDSFEILLELPFLCSGLLKLVSGRGQIRGVIVSECLRIAGGVFDGTLPDALVCLAPEVDRLGWVEVLGAPFVLFLLLALL